MRTYARVAGDSVVELLATSGDIGVMFHRDLHWIDVTDVAGLAYGWSYDGTHFAAPCPVEVEPLAGTMGSARGA